MTSSSHREVRHAWRACFCNASAIIEALPVPPALSWLWLGVLLPVGFPALPVVSLLPAG